MKLKQIDLKLKKGDDKEWIASLVKKGFKFNEDKKTLIYSVGHLIDPGYKINRIGKVIDIYGDRLVRVFVCECCGAEEKRDTMKEFVVKK